MLRAVTFGQCIFDTPGARIAPDSELHFALLLLVVTSPTDGVSRDDVVSLLWPEAVGNDGRHCLRQGMYRLRQLGIPVQLNAGRIILDWSDARADVHDLLLREPDRAELVRLGTLPFLPGYLPTLGERFGYWLDELRTRVAARLRRALADEASAARGRGRFHEMGRLARALLALDPLNELGTIILAESLALEGSKVEALRLLEAYEAEVGVVNPNLQLPARVLRRRVAEVLDDSLFLRRYEVPFVGREETFSTLRGVWREVRRGESCAAIVSGEAGIGKSRMAGELLRLAALDGGNVVRYTTSAGDAFTPLSTLIAVGSQLLTLPGALGCDQEYLNYLRRLGTADTVTAFSVAGMAADVLYAQLVQAFAEVMSAIAEEAPVVVFIDDAERLHPTTWRVLVDVWDRVGQRAVMILLAARRLPEWFGSLGVRSCERLTVHVPVPPLSEGEARDFVGGWRERHDLTLDPAGVDMLIGAGHGNPFYLTELANHLGRGGDPQRTPDNIAALIATQCRGLGKGAQQVLLAISVLESRASTSRATQVLELPAADFMAALEELDVVGLVTSVGPTVRVRHQMIGEVVQGLAGASVVDFTHGRVGAVLEREADETDSVELLGDCVTHWERAGETRRAFAAAMKLGHRLIGLGLGEEAEKAFARANALARDSEQEGAATEGLLIAHRLSAKWFAIADAYDSLRNIRSNALQMPFVADEFYLLALESSIWSNSPNRELAEVLDFAENVRLAPTLRLRAATICAMYADNCYDHAAIRRSYESVQDLEAAADNHSDSLFLQLVFNCAVGDRTQIFDLATQLADVSRHSSDFLHRIQGMRRAAVGVARAGRFAEAESMLQNVLALTEKVALPHQSFATLELLVDASLAQGEVERARQCLAMMQTYGIVDDADYLKAMRDAAAVRVAWALRDASIVSHIESGAFANRQTSIPFYHHQLLTNEAAICSIRGCEPYDESMEHRLLELHMLSRGMGRQDFTSEVLFSMLSAAGRLQAARDLARDYVEVFRREHNTPPAAITTLVAAASTSALPQSEEVRAMSLSRKPRSRTKRPES